LEEAMKSLAAVILAAGKGTRMKSRIPKVLHPLAGLPMIHYPIELARSLGADPIVVVVGYAAQSVQQALDGYGLRFVVQDPQLGTGHALGFARVLLEEGVKDLLILSGDVPLLTEETLRAMVSCHRSHRGALTLLCGRMEDPTGYGRILRDGKGRVVRIVEEKDATDEERAIQEVNAGVYCAKARPLFRALEGLSRDNVQGEYYLTDAVEILASEGVETYETSNPEEFLGINDRMELAHAEEVLQWRLRRHWMREGVTLRDPDSVYLDWRAVIGRDTVLGPNVEVRGGSRIGENCRIEAGCVLEDVELEDEVTVRPWCVIQGSRVEAGSTIGPFAHIRPGSRIGPSARIGNFVEVKNSRVGRGTKAAHLSYLGDAEVGEDVNIGAGTITCNYDGRFKHRTVIEDEVFVGSDTQLVAPVRVGRGALIGAGSTITKDVPAEALAVARARQVNLQGKARRRTKKG
jgi:bifunctional UDP-N-acetylglucosamine pyrophosphorylase/glucosamine-1-phosphate N-acetyltransferase